MGLRHHPPGPLLHGYIQTGQNLLMIRPSDHIRPHQISSHQMKTRTDIITSHQMKTGMTGMSSVHSPWIVVLLDVSICCWTYHSLFAQYSLFSMLIRDAKMTREKIDDHSISHQHHYHHHHVRPDVAHVTFTKAPPEMVVVVVVVGQIKREERERCVYIGRSLHTTIGG